MELYINGFIQPGIYIEEKDNGKRRRKTLKKTNDRKKTRKRGNRKNGVFYTYLEAKKVDTLAFSQREQMINHPANYASQRSFTSLFVPLLFPFRSLSLLILAPGSMMRTSFFLI